MLLNTKKIALIRDLNIVPNRIFYNGEECGIFIGYSSNTIYSNAEGVIRLIEEVTFCHVLTAEEFWKFIEAGKIIIL